MYFYEILVPFHAPQKKKKQNKQTKNKIVQKTKKTDIKFRDPSLSQYKRSIV